MFACNTCPSKHCGQCKCCPDKCCNPFGDDSKNGEKEPDSNSTTDDDTSSSEAQGSTHEQSTSVTASPFRLVAFTAEDPLITETELFVRQARAIHDKIIANEIIASSQLEKSHELRDEAKKNRDAVIAAHEQVKSTASILKNTIAGLKKYENSTHPKHKATQAFIVQLKSFDLVLQAVLERLDKLSKVANTQYWKSDKACTDIEKLVKDHHAIALSAQQALQQAEHALSDARVAVRQGNGSECQKNQDAVKHELNRLRNWSVALIANQGLVAQYLKSLEKCSADLALIKKTAEEVSMIKSKHKLSLVPLLSESSGDNSGCLSNAEVSGVELNEEKQTSSPERDDSDKDTTVVEVQQHDFHFASAAHFPMRGYDLRGHTFPKEGLIIYENMELSFDEDGHYDAHFRTNYPNHPITLRLQLQIQPCEGAPWYTITLAPIEVKRPTRFHAETQSCSKNASSMGDCQGKKSCCGDTFDCHCSGQSEVLKIFFHQMNETTRIRRTGSAQFGDRNIVANK